MVFLLSCNELIMIAIELLNCVEGPSLYLFSQGINLSGLVLRI